MSLFSVDWPEFSLQVMITFAHFLWQAGVVGLILFVAQHVAESLRDSGILQMCCVSKRRASLGEIDLREADLSGANFRYMIACVAFFSLPVCVIATLAWVHRSRGPIVMVAGDPVEAPSSPIVSANDAILTMANADIRALPPPAMPMDADLSATNPVESPPIVVETPTFALQRIQVFAPYLLLAYVVGVCFVSARLLISVIGSSRLRRTVQPIPDANLLKTIVEQCARQGLKRVPFVALCQRVSVPVVVGIIKPMILLPPALLCGLDPNQIAAILSHEMAHIRRYDLIVNMLQRIVEALLFFHPVTWWISRRISMERENCCDDVAADCMGRLPYAEALLQMAELCIGNDGRRSAALATLAATGSNSTDFGYRIRRLIDAEETTQVGFTLRSVAVGLALIALMTVSLVAWGQIPKSEDEKGGNGAARNTPEFFIQTSENQEEPTQKSNARVVYKNTGVLHGRLTVNNAVPKLPTRVVPSPSAPRIPKRAPITAEEKKKYEALQAEIQASLIEIEDESLQVDAEKGLANAFVYLAKAPADWQPNKADLQPITLTMQDYRFEPRATIIQTGQDLQLNNSGVAADNFHFEPRNNVAQNRLVMEGTEFMLERPFTSSEKMPVQAKSDMYTWKRTFLLPLDHPFAAVTDKQGRFSIEGLPPGTHTFQVWHERTGWLEKSLVVSIQAGQTTEVDRSYDLGSASQSVLRKELVRRIEAAIAQRDKASKDSSDYSLLNHRVQIKELHLAQFDFENGVAGIELPEAPEATPERIAELRDLLRFRWGLPVDGIQVGIARTDDRFRYTAGEKIPFQIFIRNITQEPITQSLRWFDAMNMAASLRRLATFDTDKNIFLSLRPNSVTLQPTELRLEPGETMELPAGRFEMDTAGLHSGIYHVDGHFPVVFPNRPGESSTRVARPIDSDGMPHDLLFRFELVGSQPTPQNIPADKLKEVAEYADIDWGKAVYGLQAGARYRNNGKPINEVGANSSETKGASTQRPVPIGAIVKTEVLVRNVSDQPIIVRFHPSTGSEVQLLSAMQSNLTEVASRSIMRRTDVPIAHDIDRTVERTLQPGEVFVAAQQDFEIQLLLDGRERPLDRPNANRHWVKGSGDYTYTAYLKLNITDSLSVSLHSGRLKMHIHADDTPLGSNNPRQASEPRALISGGSTVDAGLSEISSLIAADYAKVDPVATREWLVQFKNAEYGVGMGLTEVLQSAKQQDPVASLKILRALNEAEAECLVTCGQIPDYDLSANEWLKEVQQIQSQRLRTYLLGYPMVYRFSKESPDAALDYIQLIPK